MNLFSQRASLSDLTLAAVGIALIAQVLLNYRIVYPLALALALLAGAFAFLSAGSSIDTPVSLRERGNGTIDRPALDMSGPVRWAGWEIALLALLLGLAFVARIWENGLWPLGFTYDESTNGLEARQLMLNPTFPIWSDALSGRPTLHLHLVAAAFKLFGATPEVLRAVSAAIATLTILPLYLLARGSGGRPLAFAVAGFLAVSRWDLSYSRLGYEAILGPLFAVLAIYFLYRGLQRGSILAFILCGASVAGGQYTYVAFRLFPAAIVMMALVGLIQTWRSGDRTLRLRVTSGLGLGLLAAVIVVAPLLNFALTDWNRFSLRFREVSILNQVETKQSLEPLVESTLRHIGMFNYRGGIRAATNLPFIDGWQPGYPMLGIPFAAFFLIGFFRNLRRLNTPLGTALFATLLTSLAAGILTVVEETPHQTRALIAIIPAAYFAGEGLVATARELAGRMPRRGYTQPAAIGLVLVVAGIFEGVTYVQQLNHPEAWWDFDGRSNRVAQIIRRLPADTRVVLSTDLKEFPANNIVTFVSGRGMDSIDTVDPLATIPFPVADHPVTYLLVPPDYLMFKDGLDAAYGNPTAIKENDAYDRLLVMRVDVSTETLAGAVGLQRSVFTSASCEGPTIATSSESAAPLGQQQWPAEARCESWSGVISVPTTGQYRVSIDGNTDRSLNLTIDGREVRDAPVPLLAGYTPIKITRGAPGSPWSLKVQQADGSQIPTTLFARTDFAHGLTGYHYDNPRFEGSPFVVRRDWALYPIPLAKAPFSIVWRGSLAAPVPGNYVFELVGDDAAQLFMDGQLLLDADLAAGHRRVAAPVSLTAGEHPIEIRFHNATEAQVIELYWQPPGTSTSVRVPMQALNPLRDPN